MSDLTSRLFKLAEEIRHGNQEKADEVASAAAYLDEAFCSAPGTVLENLIIVRDNASAILDVLGAGDV